MDVKFTNKQNTTILYEILLEELKINSKSNWIPQIKQIFENNIHFFLANANFNNSLLELNKLFLKQTIIAINKLIPNLKNDKKINILSDDIIFPHKIEDIKNIKKDLFDEEFNMKKMEFDSTMNLEKPNAINFSDDYKNEKIINMEQLLSDKILERDSQIEISIDGSINSTQQNNLIKINFDEMTFDNQFINENINENININETNSKNEKINKKVNFNLKEDFEIIPEIKKTTYEEQKSIVLPKDNSLQINHQTPLEYSKNSTSNQFLPMNEFVKKINDLNSKIDILTKIVEELSSIIKNKEG